MVCKGPRATLCFRNHLQLSRGEGCIYALLFWMGMKHGHLEPGCACEFVQVAFVWEKAKVTPNIKFHSSLYIK